MKTQHDNVCKHIELCLAHSVLSVTQLCSNSAALAFRLRRPLPTPTLTTTPDPKELGRWGRSFRNVPRGAVVVVPLEGSDFSSTLGFTICSVMVPRSRQGLGSPVRRKGRAQSLLLAQETESLGSKGRCNESPPEKVLRRLNRLFSCPGYWT